MKQPTAIPVRRSSCQRGQSLVLVALMLPVLLGFVGLSTDYGRLTVNRRQLQNAADAAALAGAQDLILSSTANSASNDALSHLTLNGYSGTGNDSPYSISTSGAGTPNTITVTAQRTVPMDFMGVLGVSSKNVSATAVATVSSLNSCNTTVAGTACFPFLAWWSNGNNCSPNKLGDIIIFHDNSFVNKGGLKNCGWGGSSNNEDGYIRPNPEPFTLGTDNVLGGNSCGSEPIAQLQAAFTANQIIYLPVGKVETGGGSNTTMNIIAFVGLSLTGFTNPQTLQTSQVSDYNCPGTFYGQVVDTGGKAPGASYVLGCSDPNTGFNTCIIRLVQ